MVSGRGCMSRVACVALSMLRVDADARGITHVSYLDVQHVQHRPIGHTVRAGGEAGVDTLNY